MGKRAINVTRGSVPCPGVTNLSKVQGAHNVHIIDSWSTESTGPRLRETIDKLRSAVLLSTKQSRVSLQRLRVQTDFGACQTVNGKYSEQRRMPQMLVLYQYQDKPYPEFVFPSYYLATFINSMHLCMQFSPVRNIYTSKYPSSVSTTSNGCKGC